MGIVSPWRRLRSARGVPSPQLLLVALAYVGLAAAWSVCLPLGEAPDEPGHYNYARIVAAEGRLPAAQEEHEAFQPPLYYAMASVLVRLGDASRLPLVANADFRLDGRGSVNLLLHSREEAFPWAGWALGWHLQRLLSLSLGLLSLYGIYTCAIAIGAGAACAAMAAGLFCLTPQFTMLHGSATNDSLALCLGVWLFCGLLRLKHRGFSERRLLALGAIWGLGVLAKASLLAAAPAILLSAWWGSGGSCAPGGSRHIGRAMTGTLLVLCGAGIVCGWWLARNALVHGGPLGEQLIRQTNAVRSEPPNWGAELWGLYRSYWFRYVGLGLPEWLYLALLVPTLGALGALLIGGLRARQRQELSLRACALGLLWVGAFFAAWVRWALTVQGTDQARLLYPALAPPVALAAGATCALLRPHQGARLAMASILLIAGLNLYAFGCRMLPAFAPAPRVLLASVPDAGKPVQFGDALALLAYRFLPEVPAGGELTLEMWWEVRRPAPPNLLLELRLTAPDGSVPAWKRGSPSAGRDTTDRWASGAAIYSVHRLAVPRELPPGSYSLQAGVLEAEGGQWWLPDGMAQPIVTLGTVTVADQG